MKFFHLPLKSQMEIVIINDDKNDIDNNMDYHPYNNSWLVFV